MDVTRAKKRKPELPEEGDVGMSLPAGSVEYFGVKEGDQFTVTGTIEVTFVRDQSR